MMSVPIPLYVLTGFLGAGKTTALNQALADPQLSRSAVIVNEFGETGLDHLFIESTGEKIIELANGCVCCTIRGQLIDTLMDLPLAGIDRVIIETTGLADPVSVLQAVGAPEVAKRFSFQRLVCLADAFNASDQLIHYGEAVRQIALANRIFVSKIDMVPESQRAETMKKLAAALGRINASAPVEPVSGPAVIEALSSESGPAEAALDETRRSSLAERNNVKNASPHGSAISTVTLRHDRPLPIKAIEMFCELLTSAHASHLLRLKGVASVREEARPLVVHCVGGIMHEPQWLDAWPDELQGTTIVAILDGLDPAFVQRLFDGFADLPGVDQADSTAMTDNPLAIPGHKIG